MHGATQVTGCWMRKMRFTINASTVLCFISEGIMRGKCEAQCTAKTGTALFHVE